MRHCKPHSSNDTKKELSKTYIAKQNNSVFSWCPFNQQLLRRQRGVTITTRNCNFTTQDPNQPDPDCSPTILTLARQATEDSCLDLGMAHYDHLEEKLD